MDAVFLHPWDHGMIDLILSTSRTKPLDIGPSKNTNFMVLVTMPPLPLIVNGNPVIPTSKKNYN